MNNYDVVIVGAGPAGAVAMLEPFINGIWFYVLHKIWKKFNNLNE